MDLSGQSHRLVAAGAIAMAHAGAIYGLLSLAPVQARLDLTRPVAVHFIDESVSRDQRRPPEATLAPMPIRAEQPVLAAIDLPQPASDRAITAPQQNVVSIAPVEDASVPRLVSFVEYLREPEPRYPAVSRRLREQGVVVLRVVIDERGRACDIAIESSSGYARLDRAAQEAVASAAFRPYVEDGAPRRALVLIPIEFFLNRGTA